MATRHCVRRVLGWVGFFAFVARLPAEAFAILVSCQVFPDSQVNPDKLSNQVSPIDKVSSIDLFTPNITF